MPEYTSSDSIDNMRRDLLRQAQLIIKRAGISFRTEQLEPEPMTNTLALISMARLLNADLKQSGGSALLRAAVRAIDAVAVYQALVWSKAKPQEVSRAAVELGAVGAELARLAEKATGATATAATKRDEKNRALEIARPLWAQSPGRPVKVFAGELHAALAEAGIRRKAGTVAAWVRRWSRDGLLG